MEYYKELLAESEIKYMLSLENLINNSSFGYVIHTLDDKMEDYNKYEKVIFVVPVYFGEIHAEFAKKVISHKFNNLVVIYNGLNKESNKEDEFIKKYVGKYKKINIRVLSIFHIQIQSHI